MDLIKKNKEEIIRIAKYLFSSGSAFILDLVVFTIFNGIFLKLGIKQTLAIYLATGVARVCSSTYNYLFNSRLIFKNKSKKGIIGYFILVVVQMIMSATLVSIVKKLLPAHTTLIKFFIDVVIFIVNYFIFMDFDVEASL